MYDHEDITEENEFHLEIISQIWGKIAGDIYDQYKKRGRGAVVIFMMDDLPEELSAILPPGAEPTGRGAVAAYVPRDSLLPLENLIGEQGVLKMDHKLGQYDPETTLVFAFIQKLKNGEGKKGVKSTGYEITPSKEHAPLEMWKKERNKHPLAHFSPGNRSVKNNPIINLN